MHINYIKVTDRCSPVLLEEDSVLLLTVEDWTLKRATSNAGLPAAMMQLWLKYMGSMNKLCRM